MSSGRPKGPERRRIILNVRAELHDEVKALAIGERRTLNSQVELLIERGLQDWPRMTAITGDQPDVVAGAAA